MVYPAPDLCSIMPMDTVCLPLGVTCVAEGAGVGGYEKGRGGLQGRSEKARQQS